MKLKSNRKGMTLIEVIIAFAILAIVTSAFVLIFSTGLVNILNFGERSRSLAEANKAMEAVYSVANPGFDSLESELNSMNGAKITDSAYLYLITEGKDFNYFIQADDNGVGSGYRVTIVDFYRGGEKHVELTAFVRGS